MAFMFLAVALDLKMSLKQFKGGSSPRLYHEAINRAVL